MRSLAEDAQVNSIRQICPKELAEDIQKMGNSLEHLTSLEKYIDHRIASRKNLFLRGRTTLRRRY